MLTHNFYNKSKETLETLVANNIFIIWCKTVRRSSAAFASHVGTLKTFLNKITSKYVCYA